MIGTFKNVEDCKNSLKQEGYKFDSISDGCMIFKLEKLITIMFAEITVYKDNSASALIGEFKKSL